MKLTTPTSPRVSPSKPPPSNPQGSCFLPPPLAPSQPPPVVRLNVCLSCTSWKPPPIHVAVSRQILVFSFAPPRRIFTHNLFPTLLFSLYSPRVNRPALAESSPTIPPCVPFLYALPPLRDRPVFPPSIEARRVSYPFPLSGIGASTP